jgi:hypothetical protein
MRKSDGPNSASGLGCAKTPATALRLAGDASFVHAVEELFRRQIESPSNWSEPSLARPVPAPAEQDAEICAGGAH